MSAGNSLSNIKVRDIMSKRLISVTPETTVFQIANMMNEGRIGAVFVKKNGGDDGIITDRDFAIKIATKKLSLDTPVDQVASYPLETIDAGESIVNAAVQMSAKNIRKLGVVEGSKIIGIITSTDLVKQIKN